MRPISEPFTGNDIHFLPPEIPDDPKARTVYHVLALLCDTWDNQWGEFINSSTFKAVFIKKNPELMGLLRSMLKDGFHYMFAQLHALEMTPQALLQAQIFVRNCMCFIPYTEPPEGDIFWLPQWLEDHWEMVEHNVNRIELTNSRPCGSFFTQAIDRIYAYGLVPVEAETDLIKSQLLFIGAPPFTMPGSWLAAKSILKAGHTPGEDLYKQSREKLSRWIAAQRGVEVTGISYGGTMAFLLAIDKSADKDNKISNVHAYSPFGLYPFSKISFDAWEQRETKPDVRVILHEGDPISKLGVYKTDWQMYYLKPSPENTRKIRLLGHSFKPGLLAHGSNYAGLSSTEFVEIDPAEQNRANRMNNYLFYDLARRVGYVLPQGYHYGLRPILHAPEKLICHIKGQNKPYLDSDYSESVTSDFASDSSDSESVLNFTG